MKRRSMLAASLLLAVPALAHHGWSSFNQDQPLYIEGRLKSVQWRNPHAEAVLTVDKVTLPADFAKRELPEQRQQVDRAALVERMRVPTDAAGDWEIEFAPLSRMQAWNVAPLKPGDRIELIGYAGVPGQPKLMRVEYLIVNGTAYGLRSSPR